MKLNDLKAGMYGVLRNGSSIHILENGYGLIGMYGYITITLSMFYNDDLTYKYDKDRDITELWYGDKLVFERKKEAPRKECETPVDWKPEYGESYYFVYNYGNIDDYTWRNDDLDKKIFNATRIFKTKVEAEKHLEWLKAKRSIELEIARLNEGWTPDWNNIDEEKWVVAFDSDFKELDTVLNYIFKSLPNTMYLRGKALAEKLIETHEKELRIYLEVE